MSFSKYSFSFSNFNDQSDNKEGNIKPSKPQRHQGEQNHCSFSSKYSSARILTASCCCVVPCVISNARYFLKTPLIFFIGRLDLLVLSNTPLKTKQSNFISNFQLVNTLDKMSSPGAVDVALFHQRVDVNVPYVDSFRTRLQKLLVHGLPAFKVTIL